MKVLVCWVGKTDLRASEGEADGEGPIAAAVLGRAYDRIQLLADGSKIEADSYTKWLSAKTDTPIFVDFHKLKSPTDFDEIFPACRQTLIKLQKQIEDSIELTFHLSPGTPHMASSWLILSETEFPAKLIDSNYPKPGVKDVRLPLTLTAQWAPAYIKRRDVTLETAALELPPANAAFDDIIHESEVMGEIIVKAYKVALRSIPVLLEGETGTGKELFAHAIKASSLRNDGPFVIVNCGALPKELVESTLFGHVKGAFTGATASQQGVFEQADGGTLFLDEIGELPIDAQVRFLRVLEDKVIKPIGGKEKDVKKVDVRIIAATNRSLIEEVAKGNFREDLFYRLSIAVLKLPALRQRGVDIKLLIRRLLNKVNIESQDEPGYKDKKLSIKGEKLMLQHTWPGNIRELLNTLRRLAIWSEGEMISENDVSEGLLREITPQSKNNNIFELDISKGIDLSKVLDDIEHVLIEKAWTYSGQRKQKTADLLGLKNYQNLTARLKKYELE